VKDARSEGQNRAIDGRKPSGRIIVHREGNKAPRPRLFLTALEGTARDKDLYIKGDFWKKKGLEAAEKKETRV